ncbi:free fatty acid receptor 3-like [Discoglossus pictus]
MHYFEGAEALFLTVYITTFVTGLPLNLIALCTVIRKFRHKVVTVDIFLFNLTVSDLLLLSFLPFRMIEAASEMKWVMPYVFCPLSSFMYFSSIYITSLFLTAISVERYVAVAFPIKYKLFRKPAYAIGASVFIWAISISHCSIVYIVDRFVPYNGTETNSTVCYRKFTTSQLDILLPVRLEMCLVLFFVPFLVSVFCYTNFVKIIMSQPNIQKKKRHRAIGLVVGTFINFMICFTPYNISHVIGFITGQSPTWRVYALLLSTFNSSVDPLVFYCSSASFKKMFLHNVVIMVKKLHFGCHCGKLCIASCEKEIETSTQPDTPVH